MALDKLIKEGYGQVELNNVAFRRDGRIEAQCKLDETDFATIPAENGMLLAVDNVTRTIKLPSGSENELIALNYSAEHLYDERKQGLKNFKLERGTFLPRLGYLAVGDKFTTNCVAIEVESEAIEGQSEGDSEATMTITQMYDGVKAGTATVYGGVSVNGYINVGTTEPESGPILLAVEATTMPDGQPAFKFQVIKA